MIKGGLVVGIDASNIRSGGGLLHLKKILSEVSSAVDYGISEVRVWVSPAVVISLAEGGRRLAALSARICTYRIQVGVAINGIHRHTGILSVRMILCRNTEQK